MTGPGPVRDRSGTGPGPAPQFCDRSKNKTGLDPVRGPVPTGPDRVWTGFDRSKF